MIEWSFWEKPAKENDMLSGPRVFRAPADCNDSVQKAGQSGSNANRINLTLQLDNIDFRPSKWPVCPVFWTLFEDSITA
jgi:hypothetical protein